MNRPEINEQQSQILDCMVNRWNEIELLEKPERFVEAQKEVVNLVRVMPDITLLRIIAHYHNNK